jgi:hypothetical protein
MNRWPEYYYTSPELDDTVSVLLSLPWHHVLGQTFALNGNTSKPYQPDAVTLNQPHAPGEASEFWDQDITARLCELDAGSQRIQNEILLRIQPHRSMLERANALLKECEKNLRLAFFYHERSLEAIVDDCISRVPYDGWRLRDCFFSLSFVCLRLTTITMIVSGH